MLYKNELSSPMERFKLIPSKIRKKLIYQANYKTRILKSKGSKLNLNSIITAKNPMSQLKLKLESAAANQKIQINMIPDPADL